MRKITNNRDPVQISLSFSENPYIARAQRHLSQQEYLEFLEYMEQVENELSGEALGEMLLMRAQIKIFCFDETMLEDLKQAKKLLEEGTSISTVGGRFRSDCPNIFTVFVPQGGKVSQYKATLQRSVTLMEKLCGGVSSDVLAIYEAELLYNIGYVTKARELIHPVYEKSVQKPSQYVTISAAFIYLRCLIANGDTRGVEETTATLIRLSRNSTKPYYRELYRSVMGWVNSTTGWMGETPRFLESPDGQEHVLLEDRIAVMSDGLFQLGQFERALYTAAKKLNPSACMLKEVYTNLYQAMVHFKMGRDNQAVALFYETYQLTQKNRIIMPFVEYGKQILPLLQCALSRKDSARFARRWSDKLIQMATHYEESLQIIRGESENINAAITGALDAQELHILRLLVEQLTIAEVAENQGLSLEETKGQIRAIYKKIGVHNRPQAVAKAVGKRLVPMPSQYTREDNKPAEDTAYYGGNK